MDEDIYAFQLFNFTAKQITVERKHLIASLLQTGCKNFTAKATQIADTAKLFHLQGDGIVQNMLKEFDAELEELAALDKKYFQIPDNMLLPQDFDHIANYTKQQTIEIDEQIEKLTQQFSENNVMIKSLEQQKELFEQFKPCIERNIRVQQRIESAINVLNNNNLSNIRNLVQATVQVANQLQNDNLED